MGSNPTPLGYDRIAYYCYSLDPILPIKLAYTGQLYLMLQQLLKINVFKS